MRRLDGIDPKNTTEEEIMCAFILDSIDIMDNGHAKTNAIHAKNMQKHP